MPYSSLRGFMESLEKHKLLVRISEPVSTILEMTEIQSRVLQNRGPAILFENVTTENGKSKIPVLVNLFGSVERVAMGMGIGTRMKGLKDKGIKEENNSLKPSSLNPFIHLSLREIGKTLAFLRQPEPPGGWREAAAMLPLLKKIMAMAPKTVSRAPCQEIVLTGDDIDLSTLPIQTCWPDEPAPLITWPLVPWEP